jgi:hypothetical protein
MSKLKLGRPSLGTVLGLTALVVALAGNANAAPSKIIVRKGEIAPGAVTARTLAKGAVHSKALASGAVNARALANGAVSSATLGAGAVTPKALAVGAVGAGAIAADAVTASAIAPESIHGYALGPVTVHGTSIADLDEVAQNATWTASNTEPAFCGTGERLLTGGVVFTEPGNREVGVLESLPIVNANANGMIGRITSNSGGTAAAEVQAVCLK